MAYEPLKPQLPVQIRLLKVDEVDLLLELQEKSIRTLNARDYNVTEIEALVKSQLISPRAGTIAFVAEYEGQIVGFATLNVVVKRIDAIFVHPNFERQGIGRQLMVVIEQEALQREVKSLRVFSSLTAVNFYRSPGYDEYTKTEISVGQVKIRCVGMVKQLIPITLLDQIYDIVVLVLAIIILIGLLIGILFILFKVLFRW